MILRKLDQSEKNNTRPLWEEVFSEDTKEFLDYYYYIKTRENEIYVVEEEDKIRSMLHLNPYQIRVEDKIFPTAYIIAVATEEPYRGRGCMRALLTRSLNDMYGRKIPFTFLMPAAEAIYTPYDFRFIYSQWIGDIACSDSNTEKSGQDVSFSDAGLWNADEMAAFFEKYSVTPSMRWQICTVRDSAYWQTVIMEQASERGGVRLIRENGEITGMYCYAAEDGLEIREPLYFPDSEELFLSSVEELKRLSGRKNSVKVYACPEQFAQEKKPVIMARIVCLSEFLGALTVPEGVEVDCSFAVIDTLITQNSRIWRVTSGADERELHVRETEDSEGVIPIADLTELLFGRISPEEAGERDGAIVPDHLAAELGKIRKLTDVFLNEIV